MTTSYTVSNNDRVGERSERLWHVEGSRDRSDKLTELLIDCEGGSDAPGGARRDAAGGRPLVAWWEWALVFAGFVATVVLIARIVSRSRGDDWWNDWWMP
jgi:hypothetical protein